MKRITKRVFLARPYCLTGLDANSIGKDLFDVR
ncbi:hypothetical protein PHLH4_16710 [Pseudomonas sp. St316]|nr:hypothetical protein PHLH4_16710 [Pseudomonas sp. St316]